MDDFINAQRAWVSIVVGYLIVSFVEWDIVAEHWDIPARLGAAFIAAIYYVITAFGDQFDGD